MPVDAIFEESDVPSQWQSYIDINREAFERLSVDDAVSPGAGEEQPAAASSEAGEAQPAASVSISAADLNLTRDRVRRILETVEEGTLDAEVALIQLTGVRPPLRPLPLQAPPRPPRLPPPKPPSAWRRKDRP